MKYHFVWDDEKNKINFKKHGVWFEKAKAIWADPYATEAFDPEHSNDEELSKDWRIIVAQTAVGGIL